jgi:hypothetical protein
MRPLKPIRKLTIPQITLINPEKKLLPCDFIYFWTTKKDVRHDFSFLFQARFASLKTETQISRPTEVILSPQRMLS